MEPGTGKTRTTIEILRNQYNTSKQILPTLILCPPVVCGVWKKEFEKYSKVPQNKIIVLRGPQVKRVALFEKIHTYLDGKMIIVTNYESLIMPNLFSKFKDWKPDVLVADESHLLKERTAKRTKKAIELSQTATRKYILTGTAVLNSELDIHQQIMFLDGGERLGSSWFSFRAKFFYDLNSRMNKNSYFPNWQPKPGSAQEISKKISDISIVAKKSECLDLPPLVRQTIEVDLGPEQRRAYDQMQKDFIAYIGSGACVASIALTKSLRLLETLSGYLPVEQVDGEKDEKKNYIFKDNPRLQALRDLLQRLTPQHKVITWCTFRENYEQVRKICKELEVGLVEITGETPERERREATARFHDDPSMRVCLSNPSAGGLGISLISASYSIFYSRGYSLSADVQAEARNYRGGSEIHKHVTRIDIVAPGTIDEVVLKALAGKQKVADAIIDGMRKQHEKNSFTEQH